jgi:tetratricopeptide (TPR) repeat protein
MTLWPGAALALLLIAPQAPTTTAAPQASPEDVEIRAAVQQYYDAQSARDPDRAAAFWSAAANPRMTRDAFVAVFGQTAEDTYTAEVRAVELKGADARVRVAVSRTRLIMRMGVPDTFRSAFVNSQLWRREPAGWKLLRDGPFAEEIADDVMAAPSSERPALYEQHRADLVQTRLAISQRATMAITLGRNYVRGKELFELALEVSRAAADRRGEMNSLHNIGQADYFLRDYGGAADAYDKELALARDLDDQDAAGGALFGLGTVSYTKAEYTTALGQYTDALAIYEKRDDRPATGRTVVSIGNVQYLQAEYDAASASFRRGLSLALESSDRPGATFARRGLARVLAAQGDVPAALDMYRQVLADARADLQADPRLGSAVETTLESIGDLYFRIGNTDQARTALDEAKRLAEGDPESSGRVLLALGMTELVAGRFDAALANYTGSRAMFETAKNPDGMAHAWVGVGFSQSARQKFADAVAAYRAAIGLFEQKQNNDGVGRAWLGMSLAQSGGGDDTAALDSAAKVIVIAEGLHSDDLAWRGTSRSGEALRKLGRLDAAKQAFERAIASIDRLAADAPVNTEARGQLSDSASAWSGLAFTLAAQGDAAGALRAMEARRAHIRRVDLAAFQRDIVRGATPDELADEQAIVREIISTRAQLRADAQSPRREPGRADRLGQQLAALNTRRADQQARLYARLPDLPLWRGLPQPPMDAAALADLVPGARGLLVAYLVTDDELLIVSVGRDEHAPDVTAAARPIDRRAFADALAAALQPSTLQDAKAWRAQAAPISAALLDPIASRLADRDRIVIVPDDLLWKVPFDALPSGDADVGSRASVTYATSLATLARQHSALTLAEHPVAGVLAAPAIPDAIRAQLLLTLSTWKAQDADAARAAAHAAAAAYGEGVAVRAGADASESAARALLTASDVVHVQAPLQVSGATPLLSSVILAATADTPAEDGRFEARDWFGIDGRARVVVVPDGAAFGVAGVGNAMDPIAWAAASAGISSMVVGRWPADGFAADALAAAFHAKLAAGLQPADAWRAATSDARQKSAAPSAWAGLRLIGGT